MKATTESKKPYYRRAYQKGAFGSITANIPWEEKEEFRAACKREGTTMHAVLKAAAKEFTKMHAGPSA